MARSDSDLWLAVRPFAGYAARAEAAADGRVLALQIARSLLIAGAFVSFTTAGRLVPLHVVSGAVAYAMLPALQILASTIAYASIVRRGGLVRALALQLAGHAPWTLFALAISLACAVPGLAPWLVDRGVAFPAAGLALLVALVAGIVGTVACYRRAHGLSRARAAAAASIHYGAFFAAIVAWYGGTGQLRLLFG